MTDETSSAIPVLPLRDVVVYPHMVIPLFVGREKSINALDTAMQEDKKRLAKKLGKKPKFENQEENFVRWRYPDEGIYRVRAVVSDGNGVIDANDFFAYLDLFVFSCDS